MDCCQHGKEYVNCYLCSDSWKKMMENLKPENDQLTLKAALVDVMTKLEIARDWIKGTPDGTKAILSTVKSLKPIPISKDVVYNHTKPNSKIKVKP